MSREREARRNRQSRKEQRGKRCESGRGCKEEKKMKIYYFGIFVFKFKIFYCKKDKSVKPKRAQFL